MGTHPKSPRSWSVTVLENGRSGTVEYRDPLASHSFYWELGGGDVIAIISVSDPTHLPSNDHRRAEILDRVATEAIRQMAPTAKAEIDYAVATILIRATGPAPAPKHPRTDTFNRPLYYKLRLYLGLAVAAVALLVGCLKLLFSTAPTQAIPVSDSLRAGDYIVTIVRSQEPYLPSLHRDPSKDRFTLFLFICPADGSLGSRLVKLGDEYQIGQIQLAKILGFDGRFVWCYVEQLAGIEVKTGKLVRANALREANPSLSEDWTDPRRFTFANRLRVTSPDRQRHLEVEPDTLKALPAQPLPTANPFPLGPKIDDFLSAGARPTPSEWLALLSPQEAARDYKPNSRLSPLNHAANAKELRQFHRAALGPEADRSMRPILSIAPLSDETYLNAAFVRSGPAADPIRLSNPDSFLVTYTSEPGLNGTLVVARVDTSGQLLWKTDTGLHRFKLQQILPDPLYPAFIAPPPPIPDQVTHPRIAVIDTQTGALATIPLAR